MRIDQDLKLHLHPHKFQTRRPTPVPTILPAPGMELPTFPIVREPGAGSREEPGCLIEATPTPAIKLVVCSAGFPAPPYPNRDEGCLKVFGAPAGKSPAAACTPPVVLVFALAVESA